MTGFTGTIIDRKPLRGTGSKVLSGWAIRADPVCDGFTVTPPGEDGCMETRQLALITDDPSASRDWRLDDHTREVGRRGVAAARQALRAATAVERQRKEDTAPHAA